MTDNLVLDALSERSMIKFDGSTLDIDNVNSNKGAEDIVADQKAAIRAARKERDLEDGVNDKTLEKKKDEKKPEEKSDKGKALVEKDKKKEHKKKHHHKKHKHGKEMKKEAVEKKDQ